VEPIFEWDPHKDSANLEKHGIGFSEATAVFGDPLARIFVDEDHFSGRAAGDHCRSLAGETASVGVFYRAGGWPGADR